MSKPGRSWLPLDANFTRDPSIVNAGEAAGWLYLAILGQLKLTGAAGTITRGELNALGIDRIATRLGGLERVGLVKETEEPGVYSVPAWASWQHGPTDRAAYMREWRAKQRDSQGNSRE
jgi:hypothetical protein